MKIFISYATEDKDVAEQIHFALEDAGYETFFDREHIKPSEAFRNRIIDEIKQSDIFVFVISYDSVKAGKFTLEEVECNPSPAHARARGNQHE